MMDKSTLSIAELILAEQHSAVDLMCHCFGEEKREAAKMDVGASFCIEYPYKPFSFVAKKNDKIIGFVQTLSSYFHANTYSIAWLSVHSTFRGQGIGAQLIDFIEKFVEKERFKSAMGTIMLVAEYKKEYYERFGYSGHSLTHDGFPILIKHIMPN